MCFLLLIFISVFLLLKNEKEHKVDYLGRLEDLENFEKKECI